jgi:FixJ family two-component response regulator
MYDKQFVCVVDDDAAVRDALSMLIEMLGVKVRAYASARDLLADPCHRDCACLVLDVRMPGMNGIELQSRLAESAAVPSIFCRNRSTTRCCSIACSRR